MGIRKQPKKVLKKLLFLKPGETYELSYGLKPFKTAQMVDSINESIGRFFGISSSIKMFGAIGERVILRLPMGNQHEQLVANYLIMCDLTNKL